MKAASEGELTRHPRLQHRAAGQLGLQPHPASSTFDATQTAVVDGGLVRVMALVRQRVGLLQPDVGYRGLLGQPVREVRAMAFRTLDGIAVAGKRVLLRADLNVPVRDGKITDLTRIERLCPTIRELAGKGARVIVCSHFDRPKGKRVPEMSLAPVATALGEVLGRKVALRRGLHRRAGRAGGRADGATATCWCWRTRASIPARRRTIRPSPPNWPSSPTSTSTTPSRPPTARMPAPRGWRNLLPAYAGRLMQAELEALEAALAHPARPVAAIVGGAKVSTKLDLLGNLVGRVDVLIIGGAMANTFLAAQGLAVGKSLQEAEMHATAREILAQRQAAKLRGAAAGRRGGGHRVEAERADPTVPVDAVPDDAMILDVGPATVESWSRRLAAVKTLVWNGPVGAFETPPFDAATVAVARRRSRRQTRRRRAAQRGRRRRHRLGAAPCRGAGPDELCLDRRRRLPGVAGRQDAAGGRRARCMRRTAGGNPPPRLPDVNRRRGRVRA